MSRAKKAIMKIRQGELDAEKANLVNQAQTEIEKIVAADAMNEEEPRSFLEDVVQHGCQSGIAPGMIYYRETCAFYQEHKDEIWDALNEDHEQTGEGDNIVAFIGTLNGARNVGSADQFENLLAWYAYERAARNILDRIENGGEAE